jgi:membrane protein involved in colicin uptake
MTNGRHNPVFRLKILAPLAILAAVVAGGLLSAFYQPESERLVPVERATPAQMRQAMARLQDDHEALNRFLERKQSETEAKDAAQARALDAARTEAAEEARRKAEAAAAYEAALAAAAQRKLAEAAQAKPAPKPEPRKEKPEEVVAAEPPASYPMPITPPVVQQKRGPIDRAIATANEWTDKTLGAAGAVVNFFTTAAGRLVRIERPASNLSSSW